MPERIYLNKIPGQERVHVELHPAEIADVLDDFTPDAEAFDSTKALYRLLVESLAVFSPTLADVAKPGPTGAPRCVCGDPIERWTGPVDPGWVHSPGSDTPCTDARPTSRDRVDKVLRIVNEWVIESNDVGGVDAGDLAWRLEQAGFPLPDTDD